MAKKKVTSKKVRETRTKVEKHIRNIHALGGEIGVGSKSLTGVDPEKVLAEIQEQSGYCDKLARELAMADEHRKEAKQDYDAAVERLRTLCRKPDMPLYEQNKADTKDE